VVAPYVYALVASAVAGALWLAACAVIIQLAEYLDEAPW
jgi:hypothetical protein